MPSESFGKIIKITGSKVTILVQYSVAVKKVSVDNFVLNYVSIGALVGTKLVDSRILVLTVEEIYESNAEHFICASISGVYDDVLKNFTFGTDSYPLIGERVFTINSNVLESILGSQHKHSSAKIGAYVYDTSISVGYNPDVLFGKHLGVFGNTGSGKTCTVVSIIQNYVRENPEKEIKFVILDVNGEYKTAFKDNEAEYLTFKQLRFHHSVLSISEYGRLFRAAEGVQFPALKDSIKKLKTIAKWNLRELPTQIDEWIKDEATEDKNGKKEAFSKNQISGYLRTMVLRIESILENNELMEIMNNPNDSSTIDTIMETDKKVVIIDLPVSGDSLDIVLYLLFKAIYQYKVEGKGTENNHDSGHLNLVLEEAHRYINADLNETKLGNYYIDKLSREGRKFGIGLIISSQVPSMLSQEIVSQCNSVIMHKITNRRDMEFMR